jgi:DnaK suppressor protein
MLNKIFQVKVLANADANLSLSQLRKLATQMVIKRHELVGMLDALNRQIATKADCSIRDAAEAASLQEEIVRASGLADQHNRTITEIDHALRRLESGCYGISEKSGEPIGHQRLSLVPWARTGSED